MFFVLGFFFVVVLCFFVFFNIYAFPFHALWLKCDYLKINASNANLNN